MMGVKLMSDFIGGRGSKCPVQYAPNYEVSFLSSGPLVIKAYLDVPL